MSQLRNVPNQVRYVVSALLITMGLVNPIDRDMVWERERMGQIALDWKVAERGKGWDLRKMLLGIGQVACGVLVFFVGL
jgi:hypothetical protein